MERKSWNQFKKLVGKCYEEQARTEKHAGYWNQTFETLQEIVKNEREHDPNFASECHLLDEVTDYAYHVGDWLIEYLYVMYARDEYGILLQSCDWLLQNFAWQEDPATEIYSIKYSALNNLGRTQEKDALCEEWMKKEPDNPEAAARAVYTKMEVQDFAAAEEIKEKLKRVQEGRETHIDNLGKLLGLDEEENQVKLSELYEDNDLNDDGDLSFY